MKTLIDLTQHLQSRGIGFSIKTFEGSDIVVSRNFLMSWFLAKETFSHVLLLDSDMSFESALVFRLLDFGQPFTCAPYPQRSLNLGRFRSAVEEAMIQDADRPADTLDLLSSVLRYNVQKSLHGTVPWQARRRAGFRTVPAAGTGLMLLTREVPERMAGSGVARRLELHDKLPLYKGARFHDFFSHKINDDGTFMYGEDQSFCLRWVEDCGGEIWLDETAVVTHHGGFMFRGEYSKSDEFSG